MRSLLKRSPNKINEKESTRDPMVEVPRMQFPPIAQTVKASAVGLRLTRV